MQPTTFFISVASGGQQFDSVMLNLLPSPQQVCLAGRLSKVACLATTDQMSTIKESSDKLLVHLCNMLINLFV